MARADPDDAVNFELATPGELDRIPEAQRRNEDSARASPRENDDTWTSSFCRFEATDLEVRNARDEKRAVAYDALTPTAATRPAESDTVADHILRRGVETEQPIR